MSGSQAGVFGLWIGTVVVGAVLVFSVAPALARTIFRERLDAVRDDCMDAVLAGRLAMTEPVEQFLRALKVQNHIARELTLVRVGMIVVSLRRIGADFTAAGRGVSFADLKPEERKLLHAYAGRVNAALSSYLVWGSPLGWVLAPLIFILSRLLNARSRRRKHQPLDIERVASDFNRSGAYNELTTRSRLLQRVA